MSKVERSVILVGDWTNQAAINELYRFVDVLTEKFNKVLPDMTVMGAAPSDETLKLNRITLITPDSSQARIEFAPLGPMAGLAFKVSVGDILGQPNITEALASAESGVTTMRTPPQLG